MFLQPRGHVISRKNNAGCYSCQIHNCDDPEKTKLTGHTVVCVNPPPVEDEKVPMYWDNSGTDYKNMSMQTIEFSKPVKVEKFQLEPKYIVHVYIKATPNKLVDAHPIFMKKWGGWEVFIFYFSHLQSILSNTYQFCMSNGNK